MDLHVASVAAKNSISRNAHKTDWLAAVELTRWFSSQLDPTDPARFDFALFGPGVMEKFDQFFLPPKPLERKRKLNWIILLQNIHLYVLDIILRDGPVHIRILLQYIVDGKPKNALSCS